MHFHQEKDYEFYEITINDKFIGRSEITFINKDDNGDYLLGFIVFGIDITNDKDEEELIKSFFDKGRKLNVEVKLY